MNSSRLVPRVASLGAAVPVRGYTSRRIKTLFKTTPVPAVRQPKTKKYISNFLILFIYLFIYIAVAIVYHRFGLASVWPNRTAHIVSDKFALFNVYFQCVIRNSHLIRRCSAPSRCQSNASAARRSGASRRAAHSPKNTM
jgi:hypothetical protein